MKKLCIVSAIFIISSCGDSTDNNATNNKVTNTDGTDTGGLTNPITIDSVKHPSGVDNSSVISTDTAAMNVQNTYKKADSVAAKKSN